MDTYIKNTDDTDNRRMDDEKNAADWAADRLNNVYDDDSENEIILSQYNLNIKKESIS